MIRLELVNEGRDYAESFGPRDLKVATEKYGDKTVLRLACGEWTVILDDVREWADYLVDLL